MQTANNNIKHGHLIGQTKKQTNQSNKNKRQRNNAVTTNFVLRVGVFLPVWRVFGG